MKINVIVFLFFLVGSNYVYAQDYKKQAELSDFSIWSEASMGYDDNVSQTSGSLENYSNQGDQYSEIMFSGDAKFWREKNHAVGLEVFFQDKSYLDLESYDYQATDLMLWVGKTDRLFFPRLGIGYARAFYGPDLYEDSYRYSISGKKTISDMLDVKYRLNFDEQNAEESINFLDGKKRYFEFFVGNYVYWNLQYQFEYNNRKDIHDSDGYSESFSPKRHSIQGWAATPKYHNFGVNLEYKYSDIRYSKVGVAPVREDIEQAYAITGVYSFENGVEVGARMRESHLNSSYPDNSHRKTEIMLFISGYFEFSGI
ncbi:hypothetical protein [Teredinibacter sp. KSP-S5-2]|uniref:hypothetical protein n=1 Tax=Teredinibacter sp. KSP-S5-2 TaxID=3034506 RepID=UPI0029342626|nr:hypothetical protein [Teredinibacter sp. KSP-S5-2]WNO10651.1 hypothetical protein P5V12_05635 [Teredinibacter sp. KSP-S5-2]